MHSLDHSLTFIKRIDPNKQLTFDWENRIKGNMYRDKGFIPSPTVILLFRRFFLINGVFSRSKLVILAKVIGGGWWIVGR